MDVNSIFVCLVTEVSAVLIDLCL